MVIKQIGERKMSYWCDCCESSEAEGKKVDYKYYSEGLHFMSKVEVDKDQVCVHCNYVAFYSKEDPTNSNRYVNKSDQQGNSEPTIFSLSVPFGGLDE